MHLKPSKLKNKRILIVGGTSGIGYAIAEAAAQEGAHVIVSSSSKSRVDQAVQNLGSYENQSGTRTHHEGFVCNLGDLENMQSNVENLFKVATKNGKFDHVIHTAGDSLTIGKLEDFTMQQIMQAGAVRFFGAYVIAQYLRNNLNEGPSTSYTITGGGSCERPLKDWSLVLSYLSGLEGMARSLARDLAPIRVNIIGLGPVDTEMWDEFKQAGTFEDVKAGMTAKMATGAFGTKDDAIEPYLYLMKDMNATGSMVFSNGGMLLM